MNARGHLGVAGLEGYLSELGADPRLGAAFTIGPATGLAPVAPPTFRLPDATYQAMEDSRMWALDSTWLPTATFSDQTACVRIENFGGGYVTSKPYINSDVAVGGCRNWAGSDVPPSCSWAVWRVAGCDSETMLRALFQLPRYLWAQKKMLGMLASKPTAAQFGPALGDAQASWVNDALSLVSALVYSTNIRFDDDGAYNWGERGRDTFAASLVTEGVLLWSQPSYVGARPPRTPSSLRVEPRFYNNMSTRMALGGKDVDPNLARTVPTSKADFAPFVWLPPQPTVRHVDSLYNNLNNSRAPALEKFKALARYSPTEFATVLAEAERQIRHYSTVNFYRWQQVAVARWVLALQELVTLMPPNQTQELAQLRTDVTAAARALSTMPEASLRAATAEEASRAGGGNPYSALIQTVISLINSTAGMIMAVIQPLLDALSRAIVEGAGAATGRPALCPSLPYLRIFDRDDCTVAIEDELARLATGSGAGSGASTTGPTTPPPPTPAKTDKGGLLVGGVIALLLLSRLS